MIKRSEKVLLNKLFTKEKNEPLKNIRKGLGSIAYIEGNPLTKTEITLSVTLNFFDAGGVPVLPAALPVALQTQFPVFIFSLTDFFGGFVTSRRLVTVIPPWVAVNQFIIGYQNVVFGILGIGVFGDLQLIYNAPAGYVAVINIHCNNVAYGTLLNSFASDLITISVLRYVVALADINQFINPLIFGYQTLFGKVFSDSIDPRMYIKPSDFQEQISDIPVNLPIDKAVLLGTQMTFNIPQFSMVLFVSKVEPLTHKK